MERKIRTVRLNFLYKKFIETQSYNNDSGNSGCIFSKRVCKAAVSKPASQQNRKQVEKECQQCIQQNVKPGYAGPDSKPDIVDCKRKGKCNAFLYVDGSGLVRIRILRVLQ
jgi:hypothetical protein